MHLQKWEHVLQKYFLALLILAQKTNTGSQNISSHEVLSESALATMPLEAAQPCHMALQKQTAAEFDDDVQITAETLQVVLSNS